MTQLPTHRFPLLHTLTQWPDPHVAGQQESARPHKCWRATPSACGTGDGTAVSHALAEAESPSSLGTVHTPAPRRGLGPHGGTALRPLLPSLLLPEFPVRSILVHDVTKSSGTPRTRTRSRSRPSLQSASRAAATLCLGELFRMFLGLFVSALRYRTGQGGDKLPNLCAQRLWWPQPSGSLSTQAPA